ncbi:MAG: hypothetical protein GY880_23780 [Planctomycetaceae bacterium]|nr:hypothetical protein [Planctomycetaceae bacterium]
MTAVNVTTQNNTVTVTTPDGSTIVDTPVTTVVTASTVGPQGPAGTGFDVDTTGKVDRSVVYYDSAAGKFFADDTWTTDTIVLGGNF